MKANRKDFEKSIPQGEAEYDVIVCGSGMAGLGAALAAGHNGARTLLLEGQGVFGGITHNCLWMQLGAWHQPGTVDEELISRGGVHALLEAKLAEFGDDAYDPWRRAAHPDYLRIVMFELLEAAGCHYRLYSPVTGVIKEGDRVTGVVVTGKEGPRTFRAKVVVDCTGDGDVAFLAGAEFNKGRKEDGMLMPVTLTFVLGNVNLPRLLAFKPGKGGSAQTKDWTKASAQEIGARYRSNPGDVSSSDEAFYRIIAEARAQGYATATWYAFCSTTLAGVVTVNNGGLWEIGSVDGTRSAELTLAERAGIQIAADFVKIARTWKIPGLAQCHLLRVGSSIAVRETRCIVGDYVITAQDVLDGLVPEDVVARARESRLDTVYYHQEAKGKTGIPYRALLPKGIEGLLVAGRCISATHDSLGGFRGMGSVMSMGQAAGVAAALAAKKGVPPRQVSAKDIQAVLVQMGVRL